MANKPQLTLLCRSEQLNKPTFLAGLLMNQEEWKAKFETILLVPERLLF